MLHTTPGEAPVAQPTTGRCARWFHALILLATVVAPVPSQAAAWEVGTPIVTYWCGPAMSEAAATQLQEGGWNLVWCGERDLDLLQQHGLRGQLTDPLLTPAALDDLSQRAKLDALIARIKGHPALYAYFLRDEPSAADFPALGRLVAYLRERDPAHLAYINLFPTYASNEQLGNTGDVVTAYRAHLRQFLDVVKPALVSYDHYQFSVKGDNDQYFLNLALIRQAALDVGLPFLNIVQACTWTPSMRVPTPDELRYLVYTTLAYGAQGISYYVYSCPNHEGAIAKADGTPTPLYHALKSLNREFVAIATELQPLRSVGVYHAGMLPRGTEPLPAALAVTLDPPLAPVEYHPSERVRGAVIGLFAPTDGRGTPNRPTHAMVVNLDYQNDAVMGLRGTGPLERFDAVSARWVSGASNRIELNLPRGGGALVRLAGAQAADAGNAPASAVANVDAEPLAGAPVDVAPWGERASWSQGRDVGIWWEDPRDLERFVVTFPEGAPLPDPATAKLQWWHSQWPEHRIPRDQPAGAGESGWGHLGDLYQGEWRDADVYHQAEGRTWTYTFRHVNLKEFPDLKGFNAEYRTTMKLRLLFDGPAPAVQKLEAFTDSVWRQTGVAIQWQSPDAARAARLEVFNGVARFPVRRSTGEPGEDPESRAGERFARVWFADSPNVNSFDGTVVTVRNGESSFSFAPSDVAAGNVVFAPALGVSVQPWGLRQSYDQLRAAVEERRRRSDQRPIYERVSGEPEQSLARALAEQPPKPGHIYLPVGTEGGRQRFGVNADGSIFCVNDRIEHPRGKDSPRLHWDAQRLTYDFGLPEGAPARRWIEDECLPIMNTQWERDGIRYTQTAFVTRLDPGSLGFPDMQADDTAVLIVKVHGRNTAQDYRLAHATLSLRADGKELPLTLRKGLLYAQHPGGERLRAAVEVQGSVTGTADGGKVHFAGNMPPGTDGFMVLRIPFITLDAQPDIFRLQDLDFDAEFRRVKSFWIARADASTQITTPIPELNRFYRADVSHLLINCGREVGSDRLNARVGSFAYGVYGNESCMMITDLDRRGLHREAERCLDTFLQYQGTVALPGDYASHDGVFNGANGWEQGGYNQHHGWIMWAMAEHYWYTGDRDWLARHADKLIKACRWISTERARTSELTGLRAIERGLLPPGSLEDIGDWRCWMSNNGFSWWGLDAVARALADIRHPEAAALQAEADAYRRDILGAFKEAARRSPLVPLRDGTWIPQIPSEVHRRGRTFGWITVTLEGPIYFLRTGLMSPDDPMAVPILSDYEDNLYLSDRYGYSWRKHGAQWFSRGGISMQPNLLCSPHPYLLRDEIPHFLRAYFNAFAACYYADTQMMCEHPLPDLGDWRGDQYKSSDESNSTYWLRLMFLEDDRGDDVLRLGMALPRAWLADGATPSIERAATHFGPVNLRFESHAADGQITAMAELPARRAPKQILLRFRHPEHRPLQRVEVNGQPWDRFNREREWVELTGLTGKTIVTAQY